MNGHEESGSGLSTESVDVRAAQPLATGALASSGQASLTDGQKSARDARARNDLAMTIKTAEAKARVEQSVTGHDQIQKPRAHVEWSSV